jgi:hypothetical protein
MNFAGLVVSLVVFLLGARLFMKSGLRQKIFAAAIQNRGGEG